MRIFVDVHGGQHAAEVGADLGTQSTEQLLRGAPGTAEARACLPGSHRLTVREVRVRRG